MSNEFEVLFKCLKREISRVEGGQHALREVYGLLKDAVERVINSIED